MKNLLLILSLLLPSSLAMGQDGTLRGRVIDAFQGEGIPLATVSLTGTTVGTAADIDGYFTLEVPSDNHMLRISAVGYSSRTLHVQDSMLDGEPITISLEPSIISHQEIVVAASSGAVNDPSASPHVQKAIEDLLDRVPGADLYQRGNFAREPVIRGMSGGQIGLVIDGMKVVGACIDRMDPTSAYVEVENLERLDLTKGGFDLSNGSQIGGTVNLVTQQAQIGQPFRLSSEVGYESASGLRRGRVVGGASKGQFGVRASFSYKHAGDFRPGGGGAIVESGYRKNNYKIDGSWQANHAHKLTASFLGDNAWGVGYPVLLMDATLAEARIYSLAHLYTPHGTSGVMRWETRVYANTVDHWMDDFSRDVLDRRVMRGMNMPMYGLTRTSGVISNGELMFGSNRIGVTLDLYRTKSFGDMWMFSLLESIPDMYLLNLGEIVVRHGAVAVDWSRPVGERFSLRVNGRLDVSPRDVTRQESIDILQGRWETDDLSRTYMLGNASATLEYAPAAGTRLRIGLANVARLPTHTENYGHYVYNYVDGYFYTGNPNLRPERSYQVEIGMDHWAKSWGFRASAFVNHIRDYIIGEGDVGLASGSDIYQFRVFQNASAARLLGGELSATGSLGAGLSLAFAGSYTRGQNLDLDEPMYLIPPLSGLLSLRLDRDGFWAEVEARMAMPQNRVARIVAEEDGTDGYFITNLRGSKTLPGGTELKLGVQNLFDTYYQEHLSFGNLPSLGRNVYIAVAHSL